MSLTHNVYPPRHGQRFRRGHLRTKKTCANPESGDYVAEVFFSLAVGFWTPILSCRGGDLWRMIGSSMVTFA